MSTPSKKISPAALIALKEALTHIYWKREDLINFVKYTIKNTAILSTIDWQHIYKYQTASELVDRMVARPDIYKEDLLALFREVMDISDFSHLNMWDDPKQKIKTAQEKVAALRVHAQGYFDLIKEKEKAEERRNVADSIRKETLSYQNKISELKLKFYALAVAEDPLKRGFDFEKFLNELFILFDLDPKSSFKIAGEQIDGAFTFDTNDYLLEAKWQKAPVNAGDLYKFAGVLSGKLKNTLGLFISINGFSSECTEVKGDGIKSMVLMDGPDLNMVLEGRITLNDLLYRKRRHASQTGNIYLTVDKILAGT